MKKNLFFWNLKKWYETFRVSWAKYTTYRLNFFLQIIGPALVFFFIKYNLWNAVYVHKDLDIIQGYNFNQMIQYHIWSMIVGLLAQGHTSMNLSEDIRLGRISSYLIYPFNFWEFHTSSYIAFQVLQIFISLFTVSALVFFNMLTMPNLTFFLQGFIFSLYVGVFWYCVQYFTGLLSFWLEETWILRVILQIGTAFLSGAIIPLELYPKGFVAALEYTPFPYLTYYPIKIFLGEGPGLIHATLAISFWILLFIILNKLLWRKGLRLYTAAGM